MDKVKKAFKRYINKLGKKIMAGHKEYLPELYTKMKPLLHRYIKSHLFNKEKIEDVIQDVFTVYLKKLDDFDDTSAYGLLFGIAKNKCLENNNVKSVVYFDDDINYEYDEHIVYICLSYEVARLTGIDRVIMEYKFFNEYTFKEISNTTGVPETTVKRKVYKFQERVKREIMNGEI